MYIGPIVGRYANRISKGQFHLDGEDIQLSLNDGVNHLHGGVHGLSKVSPHIYHDVKIITV